PRAPRVQRPGSKKNRTRGARPSEEASLAVECGCLFRFLPNVAPGDLRRSRKQAIMLLLPYAFESPAVLRDHRDYRRLLWSGRSRLPFAVAASFGGGSGRADGCC